MHELQWLREELARRQLAGVARDTGLHVNTLYDLRDGKNTNPKLSTITVLTNYFEAQK